MRFARRAHLKPAIIVGDMTEVPDRILRSGRQNQHSAYHGGDGALIVNIVGIDYHQVDLSAAAVDVAVSVELHGSAAIVVAGDASRRQDYLELSRSVIRHAC